MMNAVRGVVLSVLMLAAAQVSAACQWPAWEQFKKEYVSAEGRIIDPSDARKITTSEGQSYGLFFALAANDRDGFRKLFEWTQNNLAEGDLRARRDDLADDRKERQAHQHDAGGGGDDGSSRTRASTIRSNRNRRTASAVRHQASR